MDAITQGIEDEAHPPITDLLPNRQENLGLAAEHGFYYRAPGMAEWEARFGEADEHAGWKEIALPILQLYTESTDGSYVEAKDSALVRDRAGHSFRLSSQGNRAQYVRPCMHFVDSMWKEGTRPESRQTSARMRTGSMSVTCLTSARRHTSDAVTCCSLPTSHEVAACPTVLGVQSLGCLQEWPPDGACASRCAVPGRCGTTATRTRTSGSGRRRSCWITWRASCPTSPSRSSPATPSSRSSHRCLLPQS